MSYHVLIYIPDQGDYRSSTLLYQRLSARTAVEEFIKSKLNDKTYFDNGKTIIETDNIFVIEGDRLNFLKEETVVTKISLR